jgi:hypothetical protein
MKPPESKFETHMLEKYPSMTVTRRYHMMKGYYLHLIKGKYEGVYYTIECDLHDVQILYGFKYLEGKNTYRTIMDPAEYSFVIEEVMEIIRWVCEMKSVRLYALYHSDFIKYSSTVAIIN